MLEIFDKLDTDHDRQLSGTEVILGVEKLLGRPMPEYLMKIGKTLFEANSGHDNLLGFKQFEKYASEIWPYIHRQL